MGSGVVQTASETKTDSPHAGTAHPFPAKLSGKDAMLLAQGARVQIEEF